MADPMACLDGSAGNIFPHDGDVLLDLFRKSRYCRFETATKAPDPLPARLSADQMLCARAW